MAASPSVPHTPPSGSITISISIRFRRDVRGDDDDDTVARAASSRVVERGDVDVVVVVVVDARGGGEPRARWGDEGDDDDDGDDAGRREGDGWIGAVRDARCARIRGRVRGVRGRVDVDVDVDARRARRARRESASKVARAGERDARGVHTGRAHGWWSL